MTFDIEALRKIGWAEWDPIGLADDAQFCADEYDTYILHVADHLARGGDVEHAVAFLRSIASDHISFRSYGLRP